MINYTKYFSWTEHVDTLAQNLPMDSVGFTFCPERIAIPLTCD